MSNRIDLTQFEGMVEDLGEPCLNQDKMPLGNEWLIPHIAHLQCGYGMESDDLEQIRITVLAMSKTPDLIAELKRCYEHIDTLTAIWCNTCGKQFGKSDYGIKYHRITVPDDSLLYEYREDMQEHCIECIAPDESIEKNCICDLCYPSQE